MSSSADYTAWFSSEIKKLIDLVANQASSTDLKSQMGEIQRGVDYGMNNPNSINDLLLKLGRNFIDSLKVYQKQSQTRSHSGIPPGGQATILSGFGDIQPSSSSSPSPSSDGEDQFSVDELKGALATRKKEAVVKKMKGSLDLLKDYEES
ncbi:MAG: hypothetical protein ACXAC8_08360 [Candidatus Hodarchaeales archaeon]|jgi:hypothetical protein